MDILDYIVPKKGWSNLLPRFDTGEKEEPQAEDPGLTAPASAEAEASGTVSPPEMAASPPTKAGEGAETAAPEPANPISSLARSPAPTESSGGDGPLDSGLRDLFSEAAVMDPQLESLVNRIDHVAADDLADELKDFSRAIGAEGAGSEGTTPG